MIVLIWFCLVLMILMVLIVVLSYHMFVCAKYGVFLLFAWF